MNYFSKNIIYIYIYIYKKKRNKYKLLKTFIIKLKIKLYIHQIVSFLSFIIKVSNNL